MALAKAGEQRDGILSTSAILVHPYLDFAGMGSGGLVIADGDFAKAEALARELATAYWERRFALEPELYAPEDAVRAGLAVEGGPVVLVEAADCCGGGAAGDSVAALAALLQVELDGPALVPLVDAPRGCGLPSSWRWGRGGVGAGARARSALGTVDHRARPGAAVERW